MCTKVGLKIGCNVIGEQFTMAEDNSALAFDLSTHLCSTITELCGLGQLCNLSSFVVSSSLNSQYCHFIGLIWTLNKVMKVKHLPPGLQSVLTCCFYTCKLTPSHGLAVRLCQHLLYNIYKFSSITLVWLGYTSLYK